MTKTATKPQAKTKSKAKTPAPTPIEEQEPTAPVTAPKRTRGRPPKKRPAPPIEQPEAIEPAPAPEIIEEPAPAMAILPAPPPRGWWPFGRQATRPDVEAALVFENRVYDIEYLPRETIPPEARRWDYEGKYVWLLERVDGELKAITLTMIDKASDQDLNITPAKLYGARKWQEVDVLFKIPNTWMDRINTVFAIAIVGILAFSLFLIYSEVTGG